MSHTFYEDEQRNIHFEEWDRVLDDHLDTIHALHNGVDPHLDWVWDDREYMTFWERVLHFIHTQLEEARRVIHDCVQPIIELVEKVLPIRDAWDKITTAARDVIHWISEIVICTTTDREESLVPPHRIDARRVTHTSTKPPRPARIYRRRTP